MHVALVAAASWGTVALGWLQALHGELLLFAAFWLAIGFLDELVVDLVWLGLLAAARARAARLPPGFALRPLRGITAVFIPAWQEAAVIGTTVRHALTVWPQPDLRLYIGCYGNDPATVTAVRAAAGDDSRVRLVVHRALGPTTKGDCLNRLYRALCADERAGGWQARCVVFHDAEDMVHPAELAVFDALLEQAEFIQLPVRAEPMPGSRWVSGHYVDEFAEAHGKTMVVRAALGAGLPAAGVGFATRREVLTDLATCRRAGHAAGPAQHGRAGPFAADSLTEDYELGLQLARSARRCRYLRVRDSTGELVATRACFPDRMEAAVRQKARWIHGIACQGWDRIGWFGGVANRWMILRDRRAPLVAIVLVVAYLAMVSGGVLAMVRPGSLSRAGPPWQPTEWLVPVCLAGVLQRMVFRAVFTGREYGLAEAMRAILRIPVANVISIIATRRALSSYIGTFGRRQAKWDKTDHTHHPARFGDRPRPGAAR